jgi:antitoxin component of MazEF toxin-antitoxin module
MRVMIERLTKHGSSLALVIDRAILELLEIDADTPLSIRTDGKCLVISPASDPERRRRFKAALEAGNRKYGKMSKRLAK